MAGFRSIDADAAATEARARQLAAFGFRPFDALHLAWAEAGAATHFLTVDDALIRTAQRFQARLHTTVSGPLDYLFGGVL